MASINLANVAIGFDISKIQKGMELTRAEMRSVSKIVQDSVSPVDRYNRELSVLEKAYRGGAITANRMAEAVSHLQNKFGMQPKWDLGEKISMGMIAANQGLELGRKAFDAIRGGISAFVQESKQIDDLADSAAKLGMGYNDLVEARRAFGEISGAESGDIDSSMQKMQVNLIEARQGTNDLAKSLQTLGLDPEALARMMPVNAVKAISDELHKMPAPAEQLKLSMDLFGKSGAAMVTVLRGGVAPIQNMQDHLKATGLLMSDSSVAAIGAMNDRFERMRDHLQGVKNFVTADLANAFLGVDKTVDDMLKKMSKLRTPEQEAANKEALTKGLTLGAIGAIGGFQSMQLYQEMAVRGKEIADQQAEIDKGKREEDQLTSQLNAKNSALLDKFTSQREQLEKQLGLLRDGASVSTYDAAIRAGMSDKQAQELFQLSEMVKEEEKRNKLIKDREEEMKRWAEESKRDKLQMIDNLIEHGPGRLEEEFRKTLVLMDEFAQAGAISQQEYEQGIKLASRKFQDDRSRRDNPSNISETIAPSIKAGSVEAYKYLVSQRDKLSEHVQVQIDLQKEIVQIGKRQLSELEEANNEQRVYVTLGR